MTSSWKGRGNQYIQLVKVLFCKRPTNGKQLPAFPLEAVPGIEPPPQRWEARVLPLYHHGPCKLVKRHNVGHSKSSEKCCHSIIDMFHSNCFVVLQKFDSNECASPVVEGASNSDCQLCDSVKTDNGKKGGEKGKKNF